MTGIFSTYKTGENRVTSTILAVLRSISLNRTERLLRNLIGDERFQLIQFENQWSDGDRGVPDAVIRSDVFLVVETKIQPGMVDLQQLRRHLVRVQKVSASTRWLIVLTPDNRMPEAVEELMAENQPVVWASFRMLDQAINELLSDRMEVVSEREQFLLRELQLMLAEEKLTVDSGTAVIVAARSAYDEYLRHSVYVCQPNRPFRNVERLGFYSGGEIQQHLPRIVTSEDEVEFTPGLHPGAIGVIVDKFCELGIRENGRAYKVMILSAPDSSDTLRLPEAIRNDKTSQTGKTTAFTMSQRYVSLEKLLRAKYTSEVEE
jgi:hypothetical protein